MSAEAIAQSLATLGIAVPTIDVSIEHSDGTKVYCFAADRGDPVAL